MKNWLVDVDEFWMSKRCCFCHCETAKSNTNKKEVNSVLYCRNTFICYLPRWFRRIGDLKHFAILEKIADLLFIKSAYGSTNCTTLPVLERVVLSNTRTCTAVISPQSHCHRVLQRKCNLDTVPLGSHWIQYLSLTGSTHLSLKVWI